MRTSLKLAGALVALVLASVTASADPITVDGGWTSFYFGAVGSGASGQPYTYSSVGGTMLTVTDAYLSGDRFEVLDFGILLGLTSAPGSVGDQILDDADGALADSRWSSGSWFLGAGAHSITIETIASPYGGGGAFLRADTAQGVPDATATLPLALFGLLAVIRARRMVQV